MMRFWRPYLACVGLYVAGSLAYALGPGIEAAWFPVRVGQRIHDVARADDRLCWGWAGTKIRDLASDDLDVYLRVGASPERLVGSVYHAATGMPWSAGGAPQPGPVDTRYCTTLPPHVRASDTVSVEWLAWYPGAAGTGLWRLHIRLPDVVSEGTW